MTQTSLDLKNLPLAVINRYAKASGREINQAMVDHLAAQLRPRPPKGRPPKLIVASTPPDVVVSRLSAKLLALRTELSELKTRHQALSSRQAADIARLERRLTTLETR